MESEREKESGEGQEREERVGKRKWGEQEEMMEKGQERVLEM